MPVHEYRFTGVNVIGEPVRGTVFAPHKRAAERRISQLSENHHFEPEALERRRTFLYKVRNADGDIAKGEQKAYSAEEVREALERMGLEVVSVQQKLLDFQMKPPSADVVMFVRLAANMLRRRLPFDEILNLLIVDTGHAGLRQVMRDLSSDLKSGMDARQAFLKHQNVLGKFTAYMLGLAAVSGNMAEMFEATAKYLERKDEFKKNVRAALITPTITFIAAIAATVWYVWILNPQIIGMFSEFDVVLPPFTAFSMAFADWMDIYGWLAVTISIGGIIGFLIFARTTKGQFYIHKYMIRVPYIGPLLHKLNLEIFCRVFTVLYTGSSDNQEVMKIASEATGNTYIEHQVKTVTIPTMMARGTDLIVAMDASKVFLPLMIARFRSGAETGSVRDSADEMAEFYQKETDLKLAAALEAIKNSLAIFVGLIVLFLTVLSAETALMMPDTSQMMFNNGR